MFVYVCVRVCVVISEDLSDAKVSEEANRPAAIGLMCLCAYSTIVDVVTHVPTEDLCDATNTKPLR